MHQCVKCGTLHDDGSQDLLKGCSCGGKFFFFIKKEHLEEAKEITENLSDKEKDQIKKDVLDIVGLDSVDDNPVILDLESIKVMKPGKYDIDLIFGLPGITDNDYISALNFAKKCRCLNRLKCYQLAYYPKLDILNKNRII